MPHINYNVGQNKYKKAALTDGFLLLVRALGLFRFAPPSRSSPVATGILKSAFRLASNLFLERSHHFALLPTKKHP
jgi:hypothetical protein